MEGVARKILVTGCNKGIGYGIVAGLCQKDPVPHIIMACRDEGRATAAKQELETKYPAAQGKIEVAVVNVADLKSVEAHVDWVKNTHGQIDCLVNNAGIALNGVPNNEENARTTSQLNYFGTIHLTKLMLPLIKDNGKVVNVTSQAGLFSTVSEENSNKLLGPDANEEIISQMYEQFLSSYAGKGPVAIGYPDSMYGCSKKFLNAWVKWWAQGADVLARGIQVYALCPGYVATDMNSFKGPRSVEQGADTPLWLIDLPYQMDESKQGKFFYERQKISLLGSFGQPIKE